GAGITVDGKTPGLFQLAHTRGSAFLSVRALFPKASANLNIRWNDHTYVFELTESDQPVLSLNLAAPPTPEEEGVGHAPEVSPLKLLALLDKALYPDADIRAQAFEQTKIADGFYDLAISNVPF